MSIITINPATNENLAEYTEFSLEEINARIEISQKSWQNWRKTSFNHRAGLMLNAARILRQKKDDFARLMALEMGKPYAQGIAEAEKCAWACEYFAENAEQQLNDINIKTECKDSFVSFQPLGPILAIMPWNFPFWQVFRFAAPNLMAGNTGLLKHARNTMGCAVEIEKIFLEAGFPEGVFSNLVIGPKPVSDIIGHQCIQAVTITGSTPVGMEVAAKAGSVLKKIVLELGGSDPYIVLDDADLEQAAESCTVARLLNSGQSCIAAKRFIAMESVLSEFEELFSSKMLARKMGNPLDLSNSVGPQARKDLQLDLQRQVDDSVSKGAKLLVGGSLPDSSGFFYPPTVLTNVKKGMAAYDEEVFGPVAAIISAKTEQEAIEIANDTIFGLGAAIYTGDIEKGRRIAREELNAGSCFVNDFVKSDPRLPFGGIKQSGFGRELSVFGIREFVNIKTVVVK